MANDNSWQQTSPFNANPPGHADWIESVERTLGGTHSMDALVSRTADGFDIQPLYTQHTNAPFYTRGVEAWEIRQAYNTDNQLRTNREILSDLKDGVNAVELTPHPSMATVTDLQQLLKDVLMPMINLSLTPAANNAIYGSLLLGYCQNLNLDKDELDCSLNIDPIGALALTGQSAESDLKQAADIAAYCHSNYKKINSLCSDSSIYHNAGATEAQELACLLATTVEYLRALNTLNVEAAFRQLRFRLALDSDYFLSIAKLRAARELINQVAAQCSADNGGADHPAVTIDAVSSSRSMAALDLSVNILRSSTQAAAAMAGGANGFTCTAFDSLSEGSAKAKRLARNTHHILKEESGLLNIHDPARGSGYIEALTEGLCTSAWSLFQQIESNGGMQQALKTGYIQQQIKIARETRESAIATGRKPIIGVSEFPNSQETTARAADTTTSFKPLKQTSDKSADALINAMAAGDNISDHFSENTQALISEPLTHYRDSEQFETLRLRSNAADKLSPVSLITIGDKKDYSARVAFCSSFFSIAGIETTVISIDNAKQTDSQLLVLCSSDEQYLAEAEKACDHFAAKEVWIAGNNPQVISALENKISESVHLHCDRLDLLDKALALLGVPAP